MTATHPRPRTYKTGTRPRRRRPLPRITATGSIGAAVILAGAAKTWPVATGIILGLIAAAAVLAVMDPHRLLGLWQILDRIPHRAPQLPAPGYRTIDWFLRLDATQFEHAIAQLAASHPDVQQAQHHGRSADRGIDVLVTLHTGRRILIQCKRYTPGKTNVGGNTIREIVGSVLAANCHAGVIVTTSGYTAEAYATNGALGTRALSLVDGTALEQWANGGHAPW